MSKNQKNKKFTDFPLALPAAIRDCVVFSDKQLEKLRAELRKVLGDKDLGFCVVTGGSYARREASKESDIDYFLIAKSKEAAQIASKHFSDIERAIDRIVPIAPSAGGPFGNRTETIFDMLTNIGGDDDSNQKITRRILFLLEGEWLFGESHFSDFRKQTIGRYIRPGITDHQLSRFLLNDLIRYYRTICVDFEFKTVEKGKEWGIRNIKLIFSRKLLYFSGVLVTAETFQQTYEAKLTRTYELLNMTPIDRLRQVCGMRAEKALEQYASFLELVSTANFRQMAKRITVERASHTEEFKQIKNMGHHFGWELSTVLRTTYYDGHPIHNAVVL